MVRRFHNLLWHAEERQGINERRSMKVSSSLICCAPWIDMNRFDSFWCRYGFFRVGRVETEFELTEVNWPQGRYVINVYGHFPKRYSKQKRINLTFEYRFHVLQFLLVAGPQLNALVLQGSARFAQGLRKVCNRNNYDKDLTYVWWMVFDLDNSIVNDSLAWEISKDVLITFLIFSSLT